MCIRIGRSPVSQSRGPALSYRQACAVLLLVTITACALATHGGGDERNNQADMPVRSDAGVNLGQLRDSRSLSAGFHQGSRSLLVPAGLLEVRPDLRDGNEGVGWPGPTIESVLQRTGGEEEVDERTPESGGPLPDGRDVDVIPGTQGDLAHEHREQRGDDHPAPGGTAEPPAPGDGLYLRQDLWPAISGIVTHYGEQAIRDLICSYDWSCDEALRVVYCESRFQPGVVSPDGRNWGLFQVNLVHLARVGGDTTALLDPATNVRVAYDIYRDAGGWRPWSCKP